MPRPVRLLPILLLALVATSARAVAGQNLLAELGTPADPARVDARLAALAPDDTGSAVRLAHALGHAGGPAAIHGVLVLLDHPSEEVRLAATEAAARIHLRHEKLRAKLAARVREASERERRAAVEALGHAGDGRDVDLLLELAASDDAALQSTAFRALEGLTGARIPYVHARWAWFWRSYRLRSELLLPQALLGLDDALQAPDLSSLAALVEDYGWTDVPSVKDAIESWLLSPDLEARAVACDLAAALRLVDLVPALEQTLRFAGHTLLADRARAALERLGAPATSSAE